MRLVLRDTERLLLRSLAAGAEVLSESRLWPAPLAYSLAEPIGRSQVLSEVDLGLLVISLHAMRQTVRRHRVLLSAGERQLLFEARADRVGHS